MIETDIDYKRVWEFCGAGKTTDEAIQDVLDKTGCKIVSYTNVRELSYFSDATNKDVHIVYFEYPQFIIERVVDKESFDFRYAIHFESDGLRKIRLAREQAEKEKEQEKLHHKKIGEQFLEEIKRQDSFNKNYNKSLNNQSLIMFGTKGI